MRRLLYVPVSAETLGELRARAEVERRRPQDEAALLIERALGTAARPDRARRIGTPETRPVTPR
jgi:hypothetical protein